MTVKEGSAFRNTVLVDTSFLISLYKADSPFHDTARKYFAQFLHQGTTVILSSIAIAEHHVKGDIPPSFYNAGNVKVVSFTRDHAIESARLFNMVPRPSGNTERTVCSADIKLIAQAVIEKAYAVITADVGTLLKYVGIIKSNGVRIRGVSITAPYDEASGAPPRS